MSLHNQDMSVSYDPAESGDSKQQDLIVLTDRGLYCAAGDFFIDAWKPVHRSFVTHGHSDHAHIGMGEYFCSVTSEPILRWRLGDQRIHALAFGEPIMMGDVRVSLHPAGHILGSSQVRVEHQGEVWIFTGDFKREPDPTCEPFELLRCDTLICEATFAYPVYAWPSTEHEIDRIIDWLGHCREQGKAAILYAYSLGKSQRVLAGLKGRLDTPVLLHGAIARGVEVYRQAGIALAPTQLVAEVPVDTDFGGRLVLAPPSAQDSAWCRRFRQFEQALASGWMLLRGNRRRRNLQRGFVISDHADWQELIDTITQCGAKRVMATHGNTDALIPYLQELGIHAQRLRTVYGDEEEPGASADETGPKLDQERLP